VGTGPSAGVAIDRTEFETALDTYYQIMGWTNDGLPTKKKMVDLGIEWAGEYLPT
jgi:aldehyde:ferredoxin oxidoreductase